MDFTLQALGTIVLLVPNTQEANDWVEEHLPEDAQRIGTAIVIEWRYADDIVMGILDDGLTIKVVR